MARGWESKSVESQIEASRETTAQASKQPASDEAKKAERERQGLLLSRTYILRQIESSSHERYTQSLRQALSEIEKKLAQLDGH